MSDVLDVAIGLVLTWFLLSLAVSAIDEALVWLFRSRAKVLWRAVGRLFTDVELPGRFSSMVARLPGGADVKAVDQAGASPNTPQDFHDRVSARIPEPARSGRTRIAHIPAEVVSDTLQSMAARPVTKAKLLAVVAPGAPLRALIEERVDDDVALDQATVAALVPEHPAELRAAWAAAIEPTTIEDLLAVISANPALARRVKTAVGVLQGNEAVQAARAEIERWFEGAMDGATRIYRRQHRKIAALIAAGIVVFANADSIGLFSRLREDRDLRSAAATVAAEWAAAPLPTTGEGSVDVGAVCARIADIDSGSTSSSTTTTTTTTAPSSTTPTTEPDTIDEARRRYDCVADLFAATELIGPVGLGTTWDEIRAADDSSSIVRDVVSFFGGSGPWGRVVTWVALLFGASFWYDVLRRLVGLKGGKPKEGSGG